MSSLLRRIHERRKKIPEPADPVEIRRKTYLFLKELQFYHGFIPGYAAQDLLRDEADFLIRHSPERGALVCTVRWCTKPFTLDIHQENGKMGFRIGSRRFSTVAELVETFVEKRQPLPIHGNMRVKNAVCLFPWEFDDEQVELKTDSSDLIKVGSEATDLSAFFGNLKNVDMWMDGSTEAITEAGSSGVGTSRAGSTMSLRSDDRDCRKMSSGVETTVSTPSLRKATSSHALRPTAYTVETRGLLTAGGKEKEVVIKTTTLNMAAAQLALFHEGYIQLKYNHPCIVHVMGMTTRRAPEVPLKLILEPMDGVLHDWLLHQQLTMDDKVRALFDIVSAMEYLTSAGFVTILHRDLAAHNCYVIRNAQGLITVKLGNFERAKECSNGIYKSPNFRRDGIPERWTAPEVFLNHTWNSQTEVWSYGVLMYEVFHDGHPPYGNAPFSVVLPQLRKGRRLDPSWDQPDKLAYLMGTCLRVDASVRPTFCKIKEQLIKFASSNGMEIL